MLNNVTRVFVGKASGAVSTASVTGALTTTKLGNIVAGDVFLVDEDNNVLTPATAAAVKAVKVVRGTGPGKLMTSDLITRASLLEREAKFQAYQAPVAQVTTIEGSTVDGAKTWRLIIVLNDDLRLIANRQTRKSYHAKTLASLVSQVNADRFISSYVVASVASGDLVLTAKPIPTVGINDYEFVSFTSSLVEVTIGATNPEVIDGVVTQKAIGGSGVASQVRQLERMSYGYFGVTNLRQFDVPYMAYSAVDGVGYDIYRLPSFKKHTGDLQMQMESPVEAVVALATGSAQKLAFEILLESFISGTDTTSGGATDPE